MTGRHDEDGKPYLAYYRNDLTIGFVWSGSLNDRVQVTREMGEPIITMFEITGDDMHQARLAHATEYDGIQIAHAFKALCEKWIDAYVGKPPVGHDPQADRIGEAAVREQIEASSSLGVEVTVGTSAGSDGAVVVNIDTEFEPDGSDDGPGLRVLINDDEAYVGTPYEPQAGEVAED